MLGLSWGTFMSHRDWYPREERSDVAYLAWLPLYWRSSHGESRRHFDCAPVPMVEPRLGAGPATERLVCSDCALVPGRRGAWRCDRLRHPAQPEPNAPAKADHGTGNQSELFRRRARSCERAFPKVRNRLDPIVTSASTRAPF